MKFIKKIRTDFIIFGLVAFFLSITASFITYKIVINKIPKIAVIDLVYLNNEFVVNLARYLAEQNIADDQMTKVVESYLSNLEIMLKDISESGNYVLLQKQSVVSDGLPDITSDIEKILFESLINKINLGVLNEEIE